MAIFKTYPGWKYTGYYTVARRYGFYLQVVQTDILRVNVANE